MPKSGWKQMLEEQGKRRNRLQEKLAELGGAKIAPVKEPPTVEEKPCAKIYILYPKK